MVLKANLESAAKLISQVVTDQNVKIELKQLASSNHDINSVAFKELVNADVIETKGQILSFKSLRQTLTHKFAGVKSVVGEEDLLDYLAQNNCYLYCPYPLEWYPENN